MEHEIPIPPYFLAADCQLTTVTFLLLIRLMLKFGISKTSE